MIAQLTNSGQVHKLYTDKTLQLHTEASVEVEENRTYHVAIFAIMEGSGIVGSSIEYVEQVTTNPAGDLTTG